MESKCGKKMMYRVQKKTYSKRVTEKRKTMVASNRLAYRFSFFTKNKIMETNNPCIEANRKMDVHVSKLGCMAQHYNFCDSKGKWRSGFTAGCKIFLDHSINSFADLRPKTFTIDETNPFCFAG